MAPIPAPVVDFVTVAERTLADLALRVGLASLWIGRVEGPDQVLLATHDPLLGLLAGDALPWADTHCRRVVELGADPILFGLRELPAAFLPFVGDREVPEVSLVSVPLTAPDGRVLATLCGVGLGDGAHLPAHLDGIRLQADLLGALLAAELELAERDRAVERAQALSGTDEVTGVAPLAAWQSALVAEEFRAARHALPVSVALVQVADIVRVNRTGGLPAGDALLHHVATALGARLRTADLLARVAGDRFAVLMPGTGVEGSAALVHRIRTALTGEGVSVRTAHATRMRDGDLARTWAAAEELLGSDEPTTATPGGASTAHRIRPADGALEKLLDLARRQLGADLAFISAVDGGHRYLRNIVSATPTALSAGTSIPLEGSLCQRVVTGGTALVVPDTSHPDTTDSGARRLGMGAYVGIPLHRRDGSTYGTLCAVSARPDRGLRERDVDVLEAVSATLMELVEAEDEALRVRRSRVARLADLNDAGGPQVVYQPVIDLATSRPVGVEALSRFPGGTPTPDLWFADAAQVGMGEELELRAIDNALRDLARLDGFLAMNLSPGTITTPGFLRRLDHLPLDRIVVEITEHSAVTDYGVLLSVLEPLRRRGLRIAVDDTGAGYASLSHVLAVLPDFIKLDISLVRGIDTDTSRRALAAGLVTFAEATDARIIAEGIETAAELAVLRELGVQLGQGYHLARPAALSSGG